MNYDLIIIGAGPAGYTAAIRAASHDVNVALIEESDVGGICLNKGCIPTKALIASAHAWANVPNLKDLGISMSEASFDYHAAKLRQLSVVSRLKKGVESLLASHRVDVIHARASFINPNAIFLDNGQAISADKIIIATGSSWKAIPSITVDGHYIVTSDHVLQWDALPKSMMIIGGGVVGCEFACLLHAFGVDITLMEITDTLLPQMDAMLSRQLMRRMKKRGIKVILNTSVNSLDIADNAVHIMDSTNIEHRCDKLLLAAGRMANTQSLNCELANVCMRDDDAIQVNDDYQTSNPSIYAIGDVIGGTMLAHKASADACRCVDYIFSSDQRVLKNIHSPIKAFPNDSIIPSPIFTIPEIGSIGYSVDELKAMDIPFTTGSFSYAANGKAQCDLTTDGQITVYAHAETEKLLGVHIIGEHASTILGEAALALQQSLTVHDIESAVHAHPTISEIFSEACADAVGHAIHKIKVKSRS